MKNESKIESLKELIADAKEAISDPALAGIYKTEIKGHIAKAEKQIEKLNRAYWTKAANSHRKTRKFLEGFPSTKPATLKKYDKWIESFERQAATAPA
tara:strand:- start:345 stop:638 length:294 start_codon:yes stop_codon:yes gene_type:complete